VGDFQVVQSLLPIAHECTRLGHKESRRLPAREKLFLHPQNQHDDFVVTVEGNPAFALLHDDPVYRQLISSMGLPAQN